MFKSLIYLKKWNNVDREAYKVVVSDIYLGRTVYKYCKLPGHC